MTEAAKPRKPRTRGKRTVMGEIARLRARVAAIDLERVQIGLEITERLGELESFQRAEEQEYAAVVDGMREVPS